MDEQITIAPSQERSAFLTSLCTISFAWQPTFLALNVTVWVYIQTAISAMQSAYGDNTDMGSYMDQASNGLLIANIAVIINMLGSIACLAGAYFMWKLQRLGYYLYLAGRVAPIAVCLYSLSKAGELGLSTMYALPLLIVPALTFLLLYGLNLKDMR